MQIGDRVRVTHADNYDFIGKKGEIIDAIYECGGDNHWYKVKFSDGWARWFKDVEPIETTEQRIQRLEQELKELKSSGWVRITNTSSGRTAVVHSERRYGFGFDLRDTWLEKLHNYNSCDPKYVEEPASQEEVEELLIKEANKRGFVAGAKIVTTWGGWRIETTCESENFEYMPDELYVAAKENPSVCIFSDGKWAKAVKRPSIEFGDHTAEIVDDCVKVGCYILSRAFVTTLAKLTDHIEVKYKGESINKKINKLAEIWKEVK